MNTVSISINNHTYLLNIVKVGREYCRPDKKHENYVRTYHSLHFVLDGFGTLCVNGKKVILGAGSVFMLKSGEQCEYYPDALKPWSYVWVNFAECSSEYDINGLFGQCGLTKDCPYVILSEYSQLADFFVQLANSYDGSALQQINCQGYFFLIIGQLIAHRNIRSRVRSSMPYKDFLRVVTYVNSNYPLNLSIKQIADDMGMSEKQLLTMFRKYIDMTPIDYINKFRISNACHFLKTMNVGVEQAARMVGIDNPKYFTRMFVKWKGVSPREYKKNCAGDNPFDWLDEKNIDSGW